MVVKASLNNFKIVEVPTILDAMVGNIQDFYYYSHQNDCFYIQVLLLMITDLIKFDLTQIAFIT